MSPPIRVGLIGLGRDTTPLTPGVWAATAHLPYLLASPKYEIVALANSTVASAQASIEFHKLGSRVKAYGSPEDLAKDPDVDLVVVSVTVGKHYALSKPALLAGKDVFVEWPLGATTVEAEELADLAASKKVKTAVGVQARSGPLVIKIKDLVDSGAIGRVLSSTVVASFGGMPHNIWMAGGEYYLEMDSGGNLFTISFGHFLDSFIHVLGEFSEVQSILKTEFSNVTILNSKGEPVGQHQKTAPDHIFVQGTLASGALTSLSFRAVMGKTVDNTGIRWLITGTEGEIEATIPDSQWQMEVPGATLKIRNGKDTETRSIELTLENEAAAVTGTPFPGTNTARVYEAFAAGEVDKFANFADAVKTHRALDLIRSAAK